MYHPTRGGTRGGAAEFSWDAVRQDKDREHYLGHSILAPTGRWQNNKDVTWYNKQDTGDGEQRNSDSNQQYATSDSTTAAAAARKQELLAIKQREEDEINKRLGKKSSTTSNGISSGNGNVGQALLRGSGDKRPSKGSGANAAPLAGTSRWSTGAAGKGAGQQDNDVQALEAGLSKDERRAARKLAKMEVRRQRGRDFGAEDDDDERRRRRARRHDEHHRSSTYDERERRHGEQRHREHRSSHRYSRSPDSGRRYREHRSSRDHNHSPDDDRRRHHEHRLRDRSPYRRSRHHPEEYLELDDKRHGRGHSRRNGDKADFERHAPQSNSQKSGERDERRGENSRK